MRRRKKMKQVILLIAALCAINFAAKSQSTNLDYSDPKFDFTWTDENGEQHTNHLTDKATDPHHILALIAKVYATPEIPGTIYANEVEKSGVINYDQHARQSTSIGGANYVDWLDGYDKPIKNPNEHGKTVLFVELKPSFKSKKGTISGDPFYNQGWSGIPYIDGVHTPIYSNLEMVEKCFESVQLLNSYMRVNDPANPGYMYTIDNISTNRFFFVSKGRYRTDAGLWPFWTAFEQISPTASGNASPTTNLAQMLKNGQVYKCIHSCGPAHIVEDGHEFTISGSGDLNAFSGLTLYLPDDRLAGGQSNYSGHQPCTFLYLCTLTAEATPSENHEGYYTINLNWGTNFNKSKIGADAEEQFYVYIVKEDGTYTLLKETDATMDTPTQSKTHSYEVPQLDDSQIIRYIVSANPIEVKDGQVSPSTIFIYSNVDQVRIPGKQAFFSEAAEYRSRFLVEKELNVYKNTVTIKPGSPNDYNKIDIEHSYEMIRKFDDGSENAERIAIAELKFKQEDDGTYTYTLKYNADAQCTDEVFDPQYPSTTETFTGTLTSADDKIKFYDYFNVSTADNKQPSAYEYVLEVQGAITSNSGLVPVYKTDVSSHLVSVTEEEVLNDNKHELDVTKGGLAVEFNGYIDVDQHIKRYDIYRLDGNTVNVGNAQCEGGYITLLKGKQQIDRQKPGTAGHKFTLPDDLTNSNASPVQYVPAISTSVKFDADPVTNTYGCERTTVAAPNLDLTVDHLVMTADKNIWKDSDGRERGGFGATINLTPTLPATTAPFAFYYRVWRVNGSESLLNAIDDVETESWHTSYAPLKAFYPEEGSAIQISAEDVYIDFMPGKSEKKIVTYIARLYSTNLYEPNDGRRKEGPVIEPLKPQYYYITEKRIDVEYDRSGKIPTGLTGVTTSKTPVSVKYYNMMGVASDKPFKGANVIVTTYSDGTRTTTKATK